MINNDAYNHHHSHHKQQQQQQFTVLFFIKAGKLLSLHMSSTLKMPTVN